MIMSTPNNKPYELIKEKKTHELTIQILKERNNNKHTLKFE